MKVEFYEIVVAQAKNYDPDLRILRTIIKKTPEEVVEYVQEDFDDTVSGTLSEEETEEINCEITIEDVEKLKANSKLSYDEEFYHEDVDYMVTWSVFKKELEV